MKVKIKNLPKQGPIQVEDNNIKQISPNIFEILGKSHTEGGTDVSYMGNTVEMQRNEPVALNSQGDLVAFGKLKIPGEKRTFESAAKNIAQKEVKVVKQADKAVNLINSSNPYDKFESLSFNTGIVLGNAAQIKQQDLNSELDILGNLQQSILDQADEMGVDPKKVVKMKNGGKMKVKIKSLPAQNGALLSADYINWLYNSPDVMGNSNYVPVGVRSNQQGTLAQRNNNPGNLRFNNQPGAVRGDKGFAKFESYEAGRQALVNDLRAKQSGKTRTGLKPSSTLQDLINVYAPKEDNNNPTSYANTVASNLGISTSTPISEIDTNQLANQIARVEDIAYATQMGNTTSQTNLTSQNVIPNTNTTAVEEVQRRPFNPDILPIGITSLPVQTNIEPQYINPETQQFQTQRPEYMNSTRTADTDIPTIQSRPTPRNRFNYLSILPEIAAIFDQPDFVPLQQYTPNLYESYRVSFQDQINQNQAGFNQTAQLLRNNPAALSTLAGQLYGANQQVLANEFRTNQDIQNQITNQNIGLLNQSQLTNIQLRDQQVGRQAQAKANTDAAKQAALTSISNKVQQNRLVNNQLAEIDRQNRIMENFSGYRMDANGNLIYQGPQANLTVGQPSFRQLTPEEQRINSQTLKNQADAEKKRAEAEAARRRGLFSMFRR